MKRVRVARSELPVAGASIRSYRLAALVLSTVLVVRFISCSGDSEAQRGAAPPVPVTVGEVVRKDMPVVVTAIGSVEAFQTVSVRSRIAGQLEKVEFHEGQDVKAGDVLFVIDQRPYQAALEMARADVERDRAREEAAIADAKRYGELVEKDYVTRQQYDQAEANADALRATVQAGGAAVSNAELNLEYCTVRAPISGRTGNLNVHQGNLIKANDDTPMVVIHQIEPALVTFSIPEQRLAEIRRYAAQGELRVSATISGDPEPHLGRVTFIDNAVDQTTGTILLKATFPNSDRALWPGQFVNVSLTLTTRQGVLVVPAAAVQTGQQGQYVYVVGPGAKAEMRPVKAGPQVGEEVIVEEGLAEGLRVVTDGQLRLTPGATVQIKSGVEPGKVSP